MGNKSKPDNKKDILKRMGYAIGHLQGVTKMIQADTYCMDIVNQNHAVIEALKKINQLILSGYMGECAWDAMHATDAAKRKQAIEELVMLYGKSAK